MKSLVINKEDLKHNINVIRNIAEKTNGKKPKIIAVVKGNGYGLDLIKYSEFLIDNGIDFLAVSTFEEAIKLKNANNKVKVLMLSTTAIKEEIEEMVEKGIIITIGSKEDLDLANEVANKVNKKVKAHLKIDTGFGRYGFCYNEKEKILESLKTNCNVEFEGAFSHFSMAFYEKNEYSKKQYKRFIEVTDYLKQNKIKLGMLHICNSSAFLKFENMRLDAVRIGSAFLGRIAIPNIYGLKRIAYLKSNIVEIKNLSKGYNIGYSNSYITKKETKIGIAPCGYVDGYNVREQRDMFRKRDKLRYIIRDIKDSFKDKSLYVEILQGNEYKRCKILGRIGMYNSIIDITDLNIKIGDFVKFNINPMFVDSSIRREYI